MSEMRNGREAQIYDRMTYPGPEPRTLVNKLGIKDLAKLDSREDQISYERMRQGLPKEANPMTYAGFRAVHRHILQDVYEWAGQERTYTTGRSKEAPFARPEHISSWMEKQFRKLAAADGFRGRSAAEFADGAADIANEINAAHPFIDGNGRTTRIWLQQLAERAGHQIAYDASDREAWNHAAKVGFLGGDHRPLAKVISACMERGAEQMREALAEKAARPSPAQALKSLEAAAGPDQAKLVGQIREQALRGEPGKPGIAQSLTAKAGTDAERALARAASDYVTAMHAVRAELPSMANARTPTAIAMRGVAKPAKAADADRGR